MRTETSIVIPRSAVAAAGRALQFTIAELTRSVKARPDAQDLLNGEILAMMDANKALNSALPLDRETGAAKLAVALDELLAMIGAGDNHMAEAVNARVVLAAWKEVSCRPNLMQIDCVTP